LVHQQASTGIKQAAIGELTAVRLRKSSIAANMTAAVCSRRQQTTAVHSRRQLQQAAVTQQQRHVSSSQTQQ